MKYETKVIDLSEIVNSFRRNCVLHLIIQLQFSHFHENLQFLSGDLKIFQTKWKRKAELDQQEKHLNYEI